jgi:hypothetical protein
MYDDRPFHIIPLLALLALAGFLAYAIFKGDDTRDYVVTAQGQCWKLSGVYLSTGDSGLSWRKGEHGPETKVSAPYRVRAVIKSDFTTALHFLQASNCAEE